MSDQVMERLVAPQDLAELLSVTTGQLAQMRYLGTGPEYVKVGHPRAVRAVGRTDVARPAAPSPNLRDRSSTAFGSDDLLHRSAPAPGAGGAASRRHGEAEGA